MPSTLLLVSRYAAVAEEQLKALHGLPLRHVLVDSVSKAIERLSRDSIDLLVIAADRVNEELVACCLRHAPNLHCIALINGTDFNHVVEAVNQLQVVACLDHHAEPEELRAAVERSLKRRANEPPPPEKVIQPSQRALLTLNEALRDLRNSAQQMVLLLSHVIAQRDGKLAIRTQAMVDQARKLAQVMSLPRRQTEILITATRLHGLGRALLPDALGAVPLSKLKGKEEKDYQQHPLLAQRVLWGVPALNEVGKVLRSQHERLDGRGYPDGLTEDLLPPLPRLLAVVRDFHEWTTGAVDGRKLGVAECLAQLQKHSGSAYDANCVEALSKVIDQGDGESIDQPNDLLVALSGARAGMVLARDLLDSEGKLLLGKGHPLDGHIIDHLTTMEADAPMKFSLHVTRGNR